jgi:PPOX class probable F420-dependent enzyme
MPAGSCATVGELPDAPRAILESGRRGFFATVDQRGRPHVVPVVYALRGDELISPIDHKPKTGTIMARVRHIETNPEASLVVDHWDEEWTRLGWVMVRGTARVETPDNAESLVARYPQYTGESHPFDALVVLSPERILWWTWGVSS